MFKFSVFTLQGSFFPTRSFNGDSDYIKNGRFSVYPPFEELTY